MKKSIKKYWGIGLIVMLITSLLIMAAPVSAADPLNWEPKIDAPAVIPFSVLAPGSNVVDYDVSGMTMYAVTGAAPGPGTKAVMQSTNGGGWWSDISTRMPADIVTADFVAVAPDDPNVVVVVDATPAAGLGAAITVNGGTSWTSMGFIQDGTGTNLAGAFNGVTISPMVTGGIRFIAVYGADAAGFASVFYYNYGAGVGTWRDATDLAAATDFIGTWTAGAGPAIYDTVDAFEFSSSFPSDWMAVTLMSDAVNAGTGTLDLHILSFNSRTWDVNVSAGYPVNIMNGSAIGGIVVNKAGLALLPDYDGSDESLRIAFAGASVTDSVIAGPSGGVWRCYDSAPAAKVFGSATLGAGTDIASVAYDGTNLAAGAYLTNNVFRSADPLTTSPTFLPARGLKRIGIDDLAANDTVLLKFAGETLYGGKIGDGSAISKSLDYGNTWNDYSLMDSGVAPFGIGTIQDIYMTAAGDPWYLTAIDATKVSVYRMSMFSVTRVLCEPFVAQNMILRGVASDPDNIYVADIAGTVIYYSADGGTGRWYQRSSVPIAPIADLVVESARVIYIGDPASVNVYKSGNAGFTWGIPVNCGLTGPNSVFSMATLGENELVVGGSFGGVTYSTDGGASWTGTMGVFNTFTAVYVAASGLATGDYIFAAETGAAVPGVWRAQVAPGPPAEFKNMNAPAQGALTAEAITGMALTDGVLYVLSSDATAGATGTYLNRTLAPTIPLAVHSGIFWGTQYFEANLDFTDFWALKTSSGAPGSIMLYAVDQGDAAAAPPRATGVYYFDDAVALGGPAVIGPADGDRIDIVSPLTGAVANVNFTWSRMSLATSYTLFIALDAGFTELVVAPIAVASPFDPVSLIQGGGTFLPGTTYYWRVAATTPISSGFSETRSFVVQPTAASVPSVASPENGGTIDSTSPAFSWTPAAGATMYQFQLSDDPAFATTLADEQLAAAGIMPAVTLDRGTTYFWRVKALQPVDGDWSTVANFIVAELAPAPPDPIVIEQVPAPVINIPAAPPATVIEIPPAPADEVISPAYIWAIIIIGAVLVIAVIVLIVRTRRQV